MVHRFESFEIDEAARELRAGGRVLPLQPRVFDLLLYLVRNRGRVVSKDELLDKLWPDVTVTDGSLQRAVSLARSALAKAGAADVIRTHARHGYRFCPVNTVGGAGQATALERARAAYVQHDWPGAMAAFQEVNELKELNADDLRCWAHAAQHAGRSSRALAPLERAVAVYRKSGDRARAAWVAVHLAQLHLEWREPVPAKGWYQRARRLLATVPSARESGYLALVGSRLALAQNEIESSHQLAESARETGERFHDPDLESLGLVYAGMTSLFLGRIREGLAALDEAGASVRELSPWAGGLVYCGVIYTCMTRADWQRAGQWTEQFTRWGADKGVVSYPGLCRLHRAEMLAVRGDLRLAEQEVRAVLDSLAVDAPWAEGEAWRVLGETLLARGDFAAARQAFLQATALGWESQFEMAQLRFAEGDAKGAASLLKRIVAENAWSARAKRGRALAHWVIASATAGKIQDARAALKELEGNPELSSTAALQALALRARGELAAADGRVADAIQCLRAALRAWLEIGAPVVAAQTRCRLAALLSADGAPESAKLELTAAEGAFRRAGADGLAAQCARTSIMGRGHEARQG